MKPRNDPDEKCCKEEALSMVKKSSYILMILLQKTYLRGDWFHIVKYEGKHLTNEKRGRSSFMIKISFILKEAKKKPSTQNGS